MKIKTLAWLSAGLPLLASCGSIVGAAIPPQTIQNPANLNGATLVGSSPMTVQRVSGSISYDTSTAVPTGSFDDIKFPDNIPFGIRPHAVTIKASFQTVTMTGPCAAPDSFNLTFDSFGVSVWNASSKDVKATLSAAPKVTVKATRTSGGVGTTTYALASNSVSVSAGQAVTDSAIAILSTGGTNDANASAMVSADDNALAGCSASFKIGDASAVLSNFK